MLTDQYTTDAVAELKLEMTAHGGPYAGLITAHGHEVVEPGSGLLRKPVTGGIGEDMHVQWEAGGADDGIRVHRIGLASRVDGPFLFHLALREPIPENPFGIVEVAFGDVIAVNGPLNITIS